MNTAVRSRLANRSLVASSVDINITVVRIHLATLIKTGFHSLQPQNAGGDFGIFHAQRRDMSDDFACFKDSSSRLTSANLFSDTMQSQRRAIGIFYLPDAEV